jgi:hypothetical protein
LRVFGHRLQSPALIEGGIAIFFAFPSTLKIVAESMSQRRIYEFNYTEFSMILRNATRANQKIDKTNKEAWLSYIKRHNVPEAAVFSRGKSASMAGNVEGVIIEGAGSSDGMYVFSRDEQICLKFDPGDE